MFAGQYSINYPGFCVQYNTWKQKNAKNGEGLVSSIMCVTSGEREVDTKMT